MRTIKVTFQVDLPDGTVQRLEWKTEAPDWGEIAAGTVEELNLLGAPCMREEMASRDANAALYCAPLELGFRSFMRRLARDVIAPAPQVARH